MFHYLLEADSLYLASSLHVRIRIISVLQRGFRNIPDAGSMPVKVIRTARHSCDEVSYLVDGNMFIGDSIPVKGDIPIFIDEQEIRKTLRILKDIKGVKTYYPAWDQTYTAEMMVCKLSEAGELVDLLKKTVLESDEGAELSVLVDRVCVRLIMPMLKSNPLFSRTIECLRQEA